MMGAHSNAWTKSPDQDCETINRFRQLGVSFLKRDDLVPGKNSQEKTANCEASMFYPKAENPYESQPSMMAATGGSHYSTVFNNYGNKYLRDSQIAMFKTDNTDESTSLSIPRLEPANVTKYGLPEDEMSEETRNLLDNTKFMTRP